MLKTNRVPVAVAPLISLGFKTLAGAQNAGVDLAQNTTARIASDLYDLAGNPATPLIPGKQARHAAQKVVVTQAYAAVATARKAGIAYCRLAIGVLKSILGTRWNSRWNAAGFVVPTLALPTDPVPTLIQFREYLNANPANEVAAIHLTAVRAQECLSQIQQAQTALAHARADQITFMRERDVALAKLRARLCGLRAELDQVLDDTDGRWHEFGFRRPADGKSPAPVIEVEVTTGGPGIVLVKWESTARAEDYRVTWRSSGSTADTETNVGLFSDTQAFLTGLPSGKSIVVGVSARNRAGETMPTEVAFAVPGVLRLDSPPV